MKRTWALVLCGVLWLAAPGCGERAERETAARAAGPAAPASTVVALVEPEPEHRSAVEKYRQAREERLRQPDGYLSLVGLHFLEPGENRFGTDPGNPIVLPVGPAHAGTLHYDGTRVRLTTPPGSGLLLEGREVRDVYLADGTDGPADRLRLDRLRLHLIARSGRHALRVRDPEATTLRDFAGLDYFPINAAWKPEATLRRHDAPVERSVDTVLDAPTTMYSVGTLEFEVEGRTYTLDALVGAPADTELFLMFKDQTSGKETYGGGRYLYAPFEGGRVSLDFNRAYNPPCAFTAYATCPLPPSSNHLPVAVEAGERAYRGAGDAAH